MDITLLINVELYNRANNAVVLFNLANAAVAGAGPYDTLTVGGQQMGSVVHSPPAVRLFSLPGRDVLYVRGAIQLYQLQSHCLLYINIILIQSCV